MGRTTQVSRMRAPSSMPKSGLFEAVGRPAPHSALKLAAAYFGIVFGAAFVLGVLRQFVFGAEFLFFEATLLVVFSWLAWKRIRVHSDHGIMGRMLIGSMSFAMLMTGEIAVASMQGLSADEILLRFEKEPYQMFGFMCQCLFGCIPTVSLLFERRLKKK